MTETRTDVRKLNDMIEPAADDPLRLDMTKRIARQVMDAVRDPKMHPSIAMKAARAVSERGLAPSELAEVLDAIIAGRKAGTIAKPGAYFVTCLKRLFQRHEIGW